MRSNAMFQKFNLHKKYQVNTLGKKDWEKVPLVRTDSNCTYGIKSRKAFLISFSKDTMVFQAEIAVIHHCPREVKSCIKVGKKVTIFSESQAN